MQLILNLTRKDCILGAHSLLKREILPDNTRIYKMLPEENKILLQRNNKNRQTIGANTRFPNSHSHFLAQNNKIQHTSELNKTKFRQRKKNGEEKAKNEYG